MQRFFDKTVRLIVFTGTPLLFAAWVCYFYPWLECMENKSFFCYLPSWLLSFFAVPGGFSELLARFFAQFFYYRAAMVAVMFLLGALLFLAARACAFGLIPQKSRYRRLWVILVGLVLFVPFWLLAYRDLAHFSVAVAYWLNLMAAWACLRLYKAEKTPKRPILPLLLFLPLCALLYYLTGPVSLLYVLLACLYGSLKTLVPKMALWVLAAWASSVVFVVPSPLQTVRGIWVRREKSADLSLQRIFARSEKMADRQQWNELIDMASAYFDKHPQPGKDFNIGRFRTRELLAVNLKLALLKSGRLNRQYFSYNHVYEMNLMLPGHKFAGEYHFANMRFAWQLGLFVPMRIYTNNMLNVAGLQNATLNVIIPNAIFLQRYDLAANYIYFLQHTLFYRRQAQKWQACNSAEKSAQDAFFNEQRHINSFRMQEEKGMELDSWVEQMYTPVSSKDVLEYYTFLQLFFKRLDSLPALAEHYRYLGFNTLPTYLQEGLLILQDYDPQQPEPPQTYADYAYSPSVLAEYGRSRQAYKLYKMGSVSAETIEKSQGFTYFFHYYFRRFLYL